MTHIILLEQYHNDNEDHGVFELEDAEIRCGVTQ